MLGTTAGGLFWMFRNLERSENTARLVEAGLRIALTRPGGGHDEWESVVNTAGAAADYLSTHQTFDGASVVDYLLRDPSNPSSVLSAMEAARNNARMVRTALTREVWEATNESWMRLTAALTKPIQDRDLPQLLSLIRRETTLVRGSLAGTMMRNDQYDFAHLGMFLERSDNTARILDVKYYLLLPPEAQVGSRLDSIQWETILRSVSAQRAFRWANPGEMNARAIASFLILDPRMPRSLAFCYSKLNDNLSYLESTYGSSVPSKAMAQDLLQSTTASSIGDIFDQGLHEFLQSRIELANQLASQIETDYRFHG